MKHDEAEERARKLIDAAWKTADEFEAFHHARSPDAGDKVSSNVHRSLHDFFAIKWMGSAYRTAWERQQTANKKIADMEATIAAAEAKAANADKVEREKAAAGRTTCEGQTQGTTRDTEWGGSRSQEGSGEWEPKSQRAQGASSFEPGHQKRFWFAGIAAPDFDSSVAAISSASREQFDAALHAMSKQIASDHRITPQQASQLAFLLSRLTWPKGRVDGISQAKIAEAVCADVNDTFLNLRLLKELNWIATLNNGGPFPNSYTFPTFAAYLASGRPMKEDHEATHTSIALEVAKPDEPRLIAQ